MTVRALDAMTGELIWEHQVADTIVQRQDHVGGWLSTAGGIVLGGADDLLVVLDVKTGKRLWEFRGGTVHAAPITYLAGNRQLFTVAVGRSIMTFGLDPQDPARR
jgi:outer membrane protein assembly factor BamB